MASIVIYVAYICNNTTYRVPAVSGALAGIMVFIAYVISSGPAEGPAPIFGARLHLTFNIAGVVLGAVVGFLVNLLVGLVLLSRMVGLATLILTVSGAVGLYTYFFSTHLHEFLLYCSIGLVFGWLMRYVLVPIDHSAA